MVQVIDSFELLEHCRQIKTFLPGLGEMSLVVYEE
jgi:hypothetical protein